MQLAAAWIVLPSTLRACGGSNQRHSLILLAGCRLMLLLLPGLTPLLLPQQSVLGIPSNTALCTTHIQERKILQRQQPVVSDGEQGQLSRSLDLQEIKMSV